MGYTTSFEGSIELSRKLTMAEAKELLEIAESDEADKTTGIDAYFQWVPDTSLQRIVWDGNEKFYKYAEQLQWLCNWLRERAVIANGSLYWQGEETGDTGVLAVSDGIVSSHPTTRESVKKARPLSLRDLQKLALEQITNR